MNKVLQEYLRACDAKPTELSDKSGITLYSISRYLTGKRVPKPNSEQIEKLARGLFLLFEEKVPDHDETQEAIFDKLQETARRVHEMPARETEIDVEHLRNLVMELGVGMGEFAEEIYYSISAISRIFSGATHPLDPDAFLRSTLDYVNRRCEDEHVRERLWDWIAKETGSIPANRDGALDILGQYLQGGFAKSKPYDPGAFLGQLNQFDYETYLAGVDTKKVDAIPTFRWKLPTTKTFHGPEGLATGILDFLKATVTSTSMAPVFLFSNHPIEQLAESPAAFDKWKKLLGAAILQGREVQVLHYLDRPMEEMLVGLEQWIPLHMTGHIRSYFIEQSQNPVFNHVLLVSGSAVLSGYSTGETDEGTYTFSKAMAEIAKGRKLADELLEQNHELIRVIDDDKAYRKFLQSHAQEPGERIVCSDSLPLFTLSDDLLTKMCERAGLGAKERRTIQSRIQKDRERIETITAHSRYREIVPAGEAIPAPSLLPLYTEEEYREHLDLTLAFAGKNPRYELIFMEDFPYSNLTMVVQNGTWAAISRRTRDRLHFLIQYPPLVESIRYQLQTLILMSK